MANENIKVVTRKLHKAVGEAMEKFQMIEEGDRIMVCLSGGKDSYTMLDMLMHIQKAAPINFELIAVNLDQKQPGFPDHILPAYLDKVGVEYKIINRDTYSIVMEKTPEGKTLCTLCSRLRRGTLYTAAKDLSCNKLALGHHRNDILETFFLNLFFAGKMETMPPKFRNDAGDLVVLRPLAFCDEDDIEVYSKAMDFPIIPCNLCGSQENMQRKKVKNMMKEWEKDFPDRDSVMFNALQNVYPSHLLDHKIYDFANLKSKVSTENHVGATDDLEV